MQAPTTYTAADGRTTRPDDDPGTPPAEVTGNNVMNLSVNGSKCTNSAYINKPCVSVTVCNPGTSTCKTIDDILLDTGSYGLRLFKSTVSGLSLTQVSAGSTSLAECVEYADGSTHWGPVKKASVIMGGEAAVTIPIQIIDSTFAAGHFDCGTPETDPVSAGMNGILGVGLFPQDCGSKCVQSANNQTYFACGSSSCAGTTVSLANQVQNPVAALPTDNNGVIIDLPEVKLGGLTSTAGYLIFGIGTQDNNAPEGVKTYAADPQYGVFSTKFNGATYDAFLDTGSNGLFFSGPSSLPDCGERDESFGGWFCPTQTISMSATNSAASGATSGSVLFNIGNFINLVSTNKSVFAENGADSGGAYFDWGLPFYFGRKVYLGIGGLKSTLGTGPYWAY